MSIFAPKSEAADLGDCRYTNSGRVVCAGAIASSRVAHHRRHARVAHRERAIVKREEAVPPKLDANGNVDAEARAFRLTDWDVAARSPHKVIWTESAGGRIQVAAWFAPRIKGFIRDVKELGFSARINCYATGGHVAHSLHYRGEACDFGQWGWGKAPAIMYRVRQLAAKWHLRDGCSFADCGHIDSGRIMVARHRAPRVHLAQLSARRHP